MYIHRIKYTLVGVGLDADRVDIGWALGEIKEAWCDELPRLRHPIIEMGDASDKGLVEV
jgi:hypothetical protein